MNNTDKDKIIAVLRAEVKAWRKYDDLHDCEDDWPPRRLASVAAHNRACEASQRTDAAGALEDK